MSATATELYKQLPLPAEIRNLPQFMEQSLSPDAGGAAVIADPTPMLRESLDRLRVMHEELAALAVESDGDRAAMRESAADIIKVARRYYELHAEMIESGLADSHPVVALCEEIAAGLEDAAETAALAGSVAFARAVAQEMADARAGS